MKKVLFLCSLVVVASIGCSTIKGIGEDLKSIGNGISNTAEKVQNNLGKSDTE